MFTEFSVKNFKSIQELTLPLGRVNVLIGENGSGKSNVLEALGLMAAATEYKLDNTALSARGIRVTSPPLMRAGFAQENAMQNIELKISDEFEKSATFLLVNDNQPYSKWEIADYSLLVRSKSGELIVFKDRVSDEKYNSSIIDKINDRIEKKLLNWKFQSNNYTVKAVNCLQK
jgi:predicted ATPase